MQGYCLHPQTTPRALTRTLLVDSLHKGASGVYGLFLALKIRPRRLARPRTPPFHGDNTGSNPVGDAKLNQ